MRYQILLFLFFLYSFNLVAKENNPSSASLNIGSLSLTLDSSKIEVKNFSEKSLLKYKTKPEFNYDEGPENKHLTWWDRFWRWLWHFIQNLLGEQEAEKSESSPILKYTLFIIAIAALVYTIIKLLGKDISNIFSKKSTSIDLPYAESLENIHEISFDEELSKAVEKKDFRLAVRLLYLNSLKELNDAHIIHWQLEKTNSAYLKEINNEELHELFTVLTRQFEYVWYGDFSVDKSSFENILTLFNNFKTKLK